MKPKLKPISQQPSTVRKLAIQFSCILNEWLTPKELAEINRRNALPANARYCATHNLCDPNVAMAEAFQIVVGRECLLPCDDPDEAALEADCNLMNAAWKVAKQNKFKVVAK